MSFGRDQQTILVYETNADEVARYRMMYKDQAKYLFDYEETLPGGKEEVYKLPNFIRLMISGEASDYDVFILRAEGGYPYYTGPNWTGIVLSEKQEKIIFFACWE